MVFIGEFVSFHGISRRVKSCAKYLKLKVYLFFIAGILPHTFGIKKFQIVCSLENDKVSKDWLKEQILGLVDYVESVDFSEFYIPTELRTKLERRKKN